MTRRIRVFALLTAIAVLISGLAQAASSMMPGGNISVAVKQAQTAALPERLTLIETGVFEGTAIRHAELPEGLLEIGDEAFARMSALETITVPGSVQVFGRDILAGSELAIVVASEGSEAANWARANGYRLMPTATWTANVRHRKALPIRGPVEGAADTEVSGGRIFRPAARQPGEVKAEACVGHRSLNVRSRFFP